MIAPYIPAICRALATEETPKIRLRNRRGLRMGSEALVSRSAKTAHMITERTSEPTTTGEPQGYVLPAQLKASNRGTAATTN